LPVFAAEIQDKPQKQIDSKALISEITEKLSKEIAKMTEKDP